MKSVARETALRIIITTRKCFDGTGNNNNGWYLLLDRFFQAGNFNGFCFFFSLFLSFLFFSFLFLFLPAFFLLMLARVNHHGKSARRRNNSQRFHSNHFKWKTGLDTLSIENVFLPHVNRHGWRLVIHNEREWKIEFCYNTFRSAFFIVLSVNVQLAYS